MSGLIWTKTVDTLMVSSLLKELYENADFEKSADDNKSMQTYQEGEEFNIKRRVRVWLDSNKNPLLSRSELWNTLGSVMKQIQLGTIFSRKRYVVSTSKNRIFCKNKCDFTPNLVEAELPLTLV